MIVQVTVVTLAGYTYSRYRFIGRKSSLMFFLVIQMVPTMAALTAFYVMAFLLEALDKILVLDNDLYRRWNSNEYLADERIL